MPNLKPLRDYDENEPIVINTWKYNLPRPQKQGKLIRMNQETQKFASMSEVVMSKQELINKLIENKAKHDVVLATAISGYWELAQQKVDGKHQKLVAQLGEWTAEAERELKKISEQIQKKETLPNYIGIKAISFDNSLGLVYPQDHSKDYDRALRMMESSVYDKVQLSVDEFDSYVLNNWEWKANFIASNSLYVDTYRTKFNKMAINVSGSLGPAGPVGAAGDVYQRASNKAAEQYAYSGISSF